MLAKLRKRVQIIILQRLFYGCFIAFFLMGIKCIFTLKFFK